MYIFNVKKIYITEKEEKFVRNYSYCLINCIKCQKKYQFINIMVKLAKKPATSFPPPSPLIQSTPPIS